jgi:hypothetical protein
VSSQPGRGPLAKTLNAVESLWQRRGARAAAAVLAFAAVTTLTVLIAHPRMFTGFANYDDEGYMLTALKGFVSHGHLYDRVFTQYGPFYYEFWGGIFSAFGIAVTHDSGRTATMLAWVASSLILGLATARIASSVLLGLAVQMLSFSALQVLCNEPMHPGGIICLLLAAIVAIAALVRARPAPYAMAALGAGVAALFLVKINLGVFAIVSLALACAVSYPRLLAPRWLRPLVEAGFVGIPFVLMQGDFGQGWARHYALHVAAAALAVVIALRARERERRDDEELVWLIGGFVVMAIVVCVAIVGAGTSVGGLIDGVIRQPLRQAGAFTIPMQLSRRLYALDLLALAAAVAYWYASRRRGGGSQAEGAWLATTSIFSIGVGVFMALSVTGKVLPFDTGSLSGYPLSFLPFAWVALIGPVPGERRDTAFARLLLPLLAVLQALHAYPVAGSQTLWSAVLLIPVGAVCAAGGARGLAASVRDATDRRALAGFGAALAVVLLWFVGNATLREPLRDAPAAYDGQVSLGLPGSGEIHLNPEEVALYRQVTAAIRDSCDSLLMLPGMDSFYLWTEEEPPSGYTATGWPTLFDDTHQRHVIEDTRSIPGLCLLKNVPLAAGWGNGTIPRGPLVAYLNRGFLPVVKIGDYALLRRDSPTPGRS